MKLLLYAGLGILTVGIILNYLLDNASWPLVLIAGGVTLKVVFITFKIIKSNYRPGWEILLLGSGLLLFFAGLYLSPHANAAIISMPTLLKITGVLLKAAFVIFFILKTRIK